MLKGEWGGGGERGREGPPGLRECSPQREGPHSVGGVGGEGGGGVWPCRVPQGLTPPRRDAMWAGRQGACPWERKGREAIQGAARAHTAKAGFHSGTQVGGG